jgi:hypothetical protein
MPDLVSFSMPLTTSLSVLTLQRYIINYMVDINA